MPRVTVNISEDVEEWLEAESDRLNWSKAKTGGHCIEVLHSTSDHISPKQTDVEPDADVHQLEERLNDVEERLASLESRPRAREPRVDEEDQYHSEDSRPLSEAPVDSQSAPEAEGSDGRGETIDDILADWRPGQGAEEREQRREIGRAVLETLRDDGLMSASDFQRELLPEQLYDDEKPSSWWKKTAKPVLDLAREVDLVEYEHGPHTYDWVG